MKTHTIKEAATYVSASEGMVRRRCRAGMPGTRKGGDGAWLIDDLAVFAKAWQAKADHSHSSAKVLAAALAAGRAPKRSASPQHKAPSVAPVDPALIAALDLQIKARLDDLQARVLAAPGFNSEDRADVIDTFSLARQVWAGCAPQPSTPVDWSEVSP